MKTKMIKYEQFMLDLWSAGDEIVVDCEWLQDKFRRQENLLRSFEVQSKRDKDYQRALECKIAILEGRLGNTKEYFHLNLEA